MPAHQPCFSCALLLCSLHLLVQRSKCVSTYRAVMCFNIQKQIKIFPEAHLFFFPLNLYLQEGIRLDLRERTEDVGKLSS